MESIMMPLQFHPIQVFDETKHIVDMVAKEYLQKATDDTHHLVPVNVLGDGNCLYHSIVVLMNNPLVTASELRGIWDNLFTPIPPVNSNFNIAILWSNVLNEKDARETHNGTWSPNHFVLLMSLPIRNEFNNTSQSASLVVTPEKKTFKNNTVTQIRTPRFQSSPSRRLRSEDNIGNDFAQSNISDSMQKEKNDKEERRQIQLQKKRERSRSSRMNETEEQRQIRLKQERERSRSNRTNESEEQRQIRLEKKKEQSRSSGTNETEKQREIRLEKKREQTQSTRTNELEEQRQIRLQKERERSRSNRTNESEEQRQIRLEKKKEQSRSSRVNETEKQREIRLEKKREQTQSARTNELEEQRQIRLEQQKKRSQTNRTKRKLEKQNNENISTGQDSTHSNWPEPISRDLKDTRLQQFLEQMSMSKLAEATCAVCNIRTSAKDAKKIPISKIPKIDLLKVSEELKTLIKNSTENTATLIDDNNTHTTSHIKSM
ncbi:unnamed protein product [Rotaria sp. Silwood1]|nr:unnamed protein product [Rotaria sp. Silwood1]